MELTMTVDMTAHPDLIPMDTTAVGRTAVDLSEEILEKIRDKKHFSKGAWARNFLGLECDPESKWATSWSVFGAETRILADARAFGRPYSDAVQKAVHTAHEQVALACGYKNRYQMENSAIGHANLMTVLQQARYMLGEGVNQAERLAWVNDFSKRLTR
jgi:hypothetical protein